jgi:hypothetical protein
MTYDRDSVVEEVRKVREEIMREFTYDPHTLGRLLALREKKYPRTPAKSSRKSVLGGVRKPERRASGRV